MRRVRLGYGSDTTPHGIELPHQPGIASPSIRRGDLLDAVVAPEPINATEGRNTAFGTHACSCEDEHTVGRRNVKHDAVLSRLNSYLAQVFKITDLRKNFPRHRKPPRK